MVLYLRIVGAVLALVGLSALFLPNVTLGPLGIEPIGAAGLSEIRANYGGMYLAIGVYLALASVRPGRQRPAIMFSALLIGGLVTGRIISLLADGYPGVLIILLFTVEAIALVWGVVLLSSRGIAEDETVIDRGEP